VLLVRGHPLEVFVVERAEALRFFGGFLAFPGGKVSASDGDIPLIREPSRDGADEDDINRCLTAAREMFEETGFLLARTSDGAQPALPADANRWRRELIDGDLSFARILIDSRLAIWRADWEYLGRFITPAFTPFRFDTAFFMVPAPPCQEADVWPGELQSGRWTTPDNLLRQWERGECLISPPTVLMLQTLRHASMSTAPEELRELFRSVNAGAIHPIYFAPDVQLVPLKTLVLPPSTHTNAYLVGRDPVYLIDPGPSDAAEQERLFAVVEANLAADRKLTAVVLTHHHPDHVGAAAACAQRYGVGIWAHPLTARALAGKMTIAREIQDGEKLWLGHAADGISEWHLEAVHTPGHARGHLSFYDPFYRLLFAGDMVSTLSSVVLAPPDGDLVAYLDSLERLRQLGARLLLPAHGNPTARVRQTLDENIDHRLKREEMLLDALRQGPRAVSELAVELYRGVPNELMRFAQFQVLAGLNKLEKEGRVQRANGDGDASWCLTIVSD
jgi:glyoxylase-like metal-dependent hydrolase (beta-lactamase superfamily II)/8-oxo-dGTP pyrophosphatase MutT (NUDIX family)